MFQLIRIILFFQLSIIIINGDLSEEDDGFRSPNSPSSSPSNETDLFSNIWNSLVITNKTSACPGECVHAITSIFCDHVLEDIPCEGSLFRCCISNNQYNLIFGNNLTADFVTNTVTELPPATATTLESFTVISNNHYTTTGYNNKKFNTNPDFHSETIATTTVEPMLYAMNNFESGRNDHNANQTIPCPVKCTKSNSFCMRPMYDAYCSKVDEECCLETDQTLDTMTKNFIKLVQQTVALNQTKNIGTEFNAIHQVSSTTTSTTISPLPPCDGTCVVPLFHMLCDEIDHNQFCSHGYCCVNREPTTTAPPISACDGTCLPVILSGMCTKSYELVLKTIDCGPGTICCARGKNIPDTNNPSFGDFSNGELNKPFVPQQSGMIIPSVMPNYPPSISNPVLPIPPRVPIQQNSVLSYPVRNNQPPPIIIDSGNKVHFLPPQLAPTTINENIHNKPAVDENPVLPVEPNFVQKEIFGCPGKCINSMFKFTCLGSHSINKNFKCSKGQICCASNIELEKLELFIHNTKMAQQQQQQQQQQVVQHPNSKLPVSPLSPLQPQPSKISNTLENISQPVIINQTPSISSFPVANENILGVGTSPIEHQPIIPHVCGVKGSKRTVRVVGGSDSYPGEWCWQIALVNQQNKYICGGAMIGKQWALTAAHCVSNYLRKNEPIFVRIGEYDLTRNNRLAQTQKVNTIYVHHNHNGQSLDNDIALLKLQSPVELNGNICLVCLPTWNSDRNKIKRCTVTGYGSKHESGPIAMNIREALVPIVNDKECVTKINSVTEKHFILPANSFCAGGQGGNDACQGDGGSGLVCESDGFYELTGLVSWGFGCGRNGVPGVYVKVSSFVGWINQIVSTNKN